MGISPELCALGIAILTVKHPRFDEPQIVRFVQYISIIGRCDSVTLTISIQLVDESL